MFCDGNANTTTILRGMIFCLMFLILKFCVGCLRVQVLLSLLARRK